MTGEQRYRLRQRFPLLPYLEQQGWKPTAYSEKDEVCVRCPLHRDNRPSFYVNRRKNVFYCQGCGQGGDVIRLVELLHGLDFQAALATLDGHEDVSAQHVWRDTCDFYQQQLDGNLEAQCYLRSRGIEDPEIVQEMGIGMHPAAVCAPIWKVWVMGARRWFPAGSSTGMAATACGGQSHFRLRRRGACTAATPTPLTAGIVFWRAPREVSTDGNAQKTARR